MIVSRRRWYRTCAESCRGWRRLVWRLLAQWNR